MIKRIGKAILAISGLTVALLLVALVVLRLAGGGTRSIFGYTAAVAVSGSMSGTFEVDDLVLVRRQSGYAIGDVVAYHTDKGELVTHRIVGQDETGFITKGDANNTRDAAPVAQSAIVGEAFAVLPKAGKVTRFLQSPLGLVLLSAAGLALLISLFLPHRQRRDMPC